MTEPLKRAITKRFSFGKSAAVAVAGLLCLASVSAYAQWTWMDKDGRKVYSDTAPPADVLDKNILKRPQGRASASAAATATTAAKSMPGAGGDGQAVAANGEPGAAIAPQNTASVPKLTGLEKELEQKKKQAADALAAKRAEEEQKITKVKIENCARGKAAKTNLDSGARIGVTNAKGEREIMDDAARASEAKRVQGIIDTNCK